VPAVATRTSMKSSSETPRRTKHSRPLPSAPSVSTVSVQPRSAASAAARFTVVSSSAALSCGAPSGVAPMVTTASPRWASSSGSMASMYSSSRPPSHPATPSSGAVVRSTVRRSSPAASFSKASAIICASGMRVKPRTMCGNGSGIDIVLLRFESPNTIECRLETGETRIVAGSAHYAKVWRSAITDALNNRLQGRRGKLRRSPWVLSTAGRLVTMAMYVRKMQKKVEPHVVIVRGRGDHRVRMRLH